MRRVTLKFIHIKKYWHKITILMTKKRLLVCYPEPNLKIICINKAAISEKNICSWQELKEFLREADKIKKGYWLIDIEELQKINHKTSLKSVLLRMQTSARKNYYKIKAFFLNSSIVKAEKTTIASET